MVYLGVVEYLFNHESERRGEKFVTRKITKWIGEFVNWEKQVAREMSPETRLNCPTQEMSPALLVLPPGRKP